MNDGGAVSDRDDDGVPSDLDCDDRDPAIGADSSRGCTSECDTGTESCTNGVWTACSASTACSCATVGEMRTVACGSCGLAAQVCGADLRWELPSECLSEGECAAAAIERDRSFCGEQVRICDAACTWRAWEVVTPPGECEVASTELVPDTCPSGQVRRRTCDDACTWQFSSACMFECVGTPAASLSGADPVCIPAGPFVLGNTEDMNSRPVRMIVLSEFHVDRVPVSKLRYQMCMDAGGCPPPEVSTLFDPGRDDQHAGGISVAGAFAFCVWDGGTLTSEFQWEKAARGPYPDARRNAWGDEDGDCRHHWWTGCREYPIALDGYPDAVSPFGVRLIGTYLEVTSTRYRDDYLWLTDGEVDPVGPLPESSYPNFTARAGVWSTGGVGVFPGPSATERRGAQRGHMFRCVY